MVTKKCPKCGETKSTDEFYKNGLTQDGLQIYCKDCLYPARKRKNANEHGSNGLSAYTPRELMVELHNRGYEGELLFTKRIDISKL